jgi:hypothetical protein
MGAETAPTRGRPTDFDQALADTICERMRAGESLRAICRDEGMPGESTVRAWAAANQHGFHAQYTRAREAQMDALAEDLIEIADDKEEDPQRARLRVDTRKWLMSKIAPKRFGDRTQHELTGRNGGPIQTQDLTHYSDERLAALAALLGADPDAGGDSGGAEA